MPAKQKADTMTDTTAAILARPTCSPAEASRVLGVGEPVIYRGVQRKVIPSCRPGRQIRIHTSWVREQLGLNQPA